MKTSPIERGRLLPESEADFKTLVTLNKCALFCIECDKPFSRENVHTREGWVETQVSGFCQDCYEDFSSSEEGENVQE